MDRPRPVHLVQVGDNGWVDRINGVTFALWQRLLTVCRDVDFVSLFRFHRRTFRCDDELKVERLTGQMDFGGPVRGSIHVVTAVPDIDEFVRSSYFLLPVGNDTPLITRVFLAKQLLSRSWETGSMASIHTFKDIFIVEYNLSITDDAFFDKICYR